MKSALTMRTFRFLAACTLGGWLLASGCTMRDIQANLAAGTLTYVKNGVTTFWSTLLPIDEWAASIAGGA